MSGLEAAHALVRLDKRQVLILFWMASSLLSDRIQFNSIGIARRVLRWRRSLVCRSHCQAPAGSLLLLSPPRFRLCLERRLLYCWACFRLQSWKWFVDQGPVAKDFLLLLLLFHGQPHFFGWFHQWREMMSESAIERSSSGLCSGDLQRRDLAEVVLLGLLLEVPHGLHGSWAEASWDSSIYSHFHPFLTPYGCIGAVDQR